MRKLFSVAGLALFCACLVVVGATAGGKAGQISYDTYTLDNGLRVVLSEDKSVPVVAVNVWYHVGSAYEDDGRSGFAHLFEHMMFEGSENVDKAEHFQFVSRAGGNLNGSTTQDRTNYYEVLPANRLNLALWLEADRMRSLVITDEKFENQRQAVKEERRMRIDNQPYGAAFLTSDTLSYDFKPYRHTVIGKMVDLDAAETKDVQAFFDKYYSPNNAVLVVVGDINKGQAKKWIKEYFGNIPRGEEVESVWEDGNYAKGERRKTIEDKNANVPAIFMAYTLPPHRQEDMPAMSLLANILTDGEASRLHKRLVKEEEAALAVFGGASGRMGPSIFRFVAVSNIGVSIETCEELIQEEIEKLQTGGIDEKELEKAKVQFKTSFILSRETVMNKAEAIQHYAYYHDSLKEINKDIDKYMAVTVEDIMRVAKKYFIKQNRTVVIANPAGKESS
jgi:predicted Zn-dependent peptidase